MATYVHGNVVRKEQVAVQTKEKQKQNKAKHLNRGYVAFLVIASLAAMFMCVQYLQLRSELTQRSKNITSMQKELVQMKEANTTKYNAIVNTMNLEEIRDIAMNEFGMVYADRDQIIRYQSPTGRNMMQYTRIPENGIVAGSNIDR